MTKLSEAQEKMWKAHPEYEGMTRGELLTLFGLGNSEDVATFVETLDLGTLDRLLRDGAMEELGLIGVSRVLKYELFMQGYMMGRHAGELAGD